MGVEVMVTHWAHDPQKLVRNLASPKKRMFAELVKAARL